MIVSEAAGQGWSRHSCLQFKTYKQKKRPCPLQHGLSEWESAEIHCCQLPSSSAVIGLAARSRWLPAGHIVTAGYNPCRSGKRVEAGIHACSSKLIDFSRALAP